MCEMIKYIFKYFIILPLVTLWICGCNNNGKQSDLNEISDVINTSPQEAINSLKKIDYASLSDADRNYYNLLYIKANDKAFIRHTTDSIITQVIDYYTNNEPSDTLLTEALYYGGRVYSDLGDYPTALRYYQDALQNLSENSDSRRLRGNIISQMGWLLNTIRLYDKARVCIEQVIDMDIEDKDSVNLMYDLLVMGNINLNLKLYDDAESNFKAASKIAESVSPGDKLQNDIYLAAVKLEEGETDSALTILRKEIKSTDNKLEGSALAYAAKIYYKAGIYDTAYLYSHNVIMSDDVQNHGTAYQILLSPEIRNYVDEDTAYAYITKYRLLIENQLNQNESQEALLQDSFFSYKLHVHEREKAEKAKQQIERWSLILCIIALFLFIIVFYLKYKNKTNLIKLHEALINVHDLRKELSGIQTSSSAETVSALNSDDLRSKLREELMSISESCNKNATVSSTIIQSEAYRKLQDYISLSRIITDDNSLWNDLETIVIESSKDFKHRLQLLTGGKFNDTDLHIALLVKCGVTPTQMTILTGRTKGTISYRREMLCLKIFDQKLGTRVVDNIIRLL